jgi:hypothetical protein
MRSARSRAGGRLLEGTDLDLRPDWGDAQAASRRQDDCIACEHEDHYDADFYIYDDVVILDLDGTVAIYGYPI